MTIRFPTEAANADVLGEDPANPQDPAAAKPPRADIASRRNPPAQQVERNHPIERGGRAAGDSRGERPRSGKDINAPGFLHDKDGDKP